MIQVGINILKNAVETIMDVDVENRLIPISLSRTAKSNIIVISDNGAGMNHQDINSIFNYGMTSKANGHSIGLHISKNYIKEREGNCTQGVKVPVKGRLFLSNYPFNVFLVQDVVNNHLQSL